VADAGCTRHHRCGPPGQNVPVLGVPRSGGLCFGRLAGWWHDVGWFASHPLKFWELHSQSTVHYVLDTPTNFGMAGQQPKHVLPHAGPVERVAPSTWGVLCCVDPPGLLRSSELNCRLLGGEGHRCLWEMGGVPTWACHERARLEGFDVLNAATQGNKGLGDRAWGTAGVVVVVLPVSSLWWWLQCGRD
jgi:hypothetical protein